MIIKEIDESLDEGKSLKAIAQSYAEIANLKVKRIRSEVERNRIFFQEISGIYGLVRKMAERQKLALRKNKKTITLLITSNYHFYGNINFDLIQFFLKNTAHVATDKLIIGKTALEFFKAANISMNFKSVVLKQDMPSPQEIASLIDIIKDYSQVLIVHSKFKTLLVQQPLVTDITPTNKPLGKEEENIGYIFEPELAKILSFFDSQVLNLLLEETFLESELSRTAARFISMDDAESAANRFIKDFERLKALTKRSLANNKILENYASQIATLGVIHE